MSQFEKWETYPVTEEKLYYARHIASTEEYAQELCRTNNREQLRDMYDRQIFQPVKGQAMNEQEITDMFSKITAMFDHVRNTFINASQLATEVAALRTEVQQVTTDLSVVRQQYAEQDYELQHVRHQRNEALTRISALEFERDNATSQANYHASNASEWQGKYDALSSRHEDLKRERDSALQEAVDWEARHNSLHHAHQQVLAKFKELSELIQPKEEQTEFPKVVSSW